MQVIQEDKFSHYKVDYFSRPLYTHISKEDLKSNNVIFQITAFLGAIPQVGLHKDKLFTIVSELYNNALEHGVLKLASTIKEMPQGFERYYELRKQRLEKLTDEYINIKIEYIKSTHSFIKIQVTDSGKGFDIANRLDESSNISISHGRGIALIRELGSSLEYKDNGRHAVACYNFDN